MTSAKQRKKMRAEVGAGVVAAVAAGAEVDWDLELEIADICRERADRWARLVGSPYDNRDVTALVRKGTTV